MNSAGRGALLRRLRGTWSVALGAWARQGVVRSRKPAQRAGAVAWDVGPTVLAMVCFVTGCAVANPVLGWWSAGVCILLTEKRVKWEGRR